MIADLQLVAATPYAAVPVDRAAPMVRVRLGDGCAVGQSHPALSVTHTIALAQAVALMRSGRCLVSLPARGDLLRWPPIALSAVEHAGLLPGGLELSFVADQVPSGATPVLLALSALRDLGVQLALRNVRPPGSELMRRLPLSTVILAASSLGPLPGSMPLVAVHNLVAQARGLGLQTVATGIETEQQRALLSGIGCQFGEGPLFGHP